MTTLRLLLGDQLNPEHSWFKHVDSEHLYTLIEMRQETDYVLHHAQKIISIFSGMRALAQRLEVEGHRVHYLRIGDPENTQTIEGNLKALIAKHRCIKFEYQQPDEWRLDAQLSSFCHALSIPSEMVSSEHFFTERLETAELFKTQKQWLMERFYRQMRVKHRVLIDASKKPEGGQWNFDHENRKRWSGTPPEPVDHTRRHDHSSLWAEIQAAGVSSFGEPQCNTFRWPVNREEALDDLERFISDVLPYFGEFQDAMSTQSWRMFHSLLSFALNVKMLSPQEVVAKAETAWRQQRISIATAEGFIRQILGWREYIRGVYWFRMPDYQDSNHFAHDTPLPTWFWTGKTKMQCVSKAVGQSLDHAYAHHIQRLMITGNFALLAGIDPSALHRWYLGIYIDAFEWVELPNTIGMSQFADAGLLATKPYVSSAAYIDRMGDYCKGCYYDKKLRVGERACPFNALYWDFFIRNASALSGNHRLGMVYRQIEKMDTESKTSLQSRAFTIRNDLDQI
ncbi:cryptochrome/photolyase family protein [Zwartia hollandica]|uniref:cryptochrome/photolyase family protein n=1 Tax=Zwartia hollandica TaxID=324606 RepID=UPI002180B437|nr:cryptochrome/photolyase family protein [Zwartia hollandica]